MLATGLPRPRRPWLLLAALAARPCGAWVVFDGARLDEAVPGGQFAKNTSNVLSTYETMRLINTDGFPAAFRWSAQPALRYAISPDFCKSMSGHIIEEDGWIKDMWCAGVRTPPPEPLPHSHTRRRGRRPSQRRSASLSLRPRRAHLHRRRRRRPIMPPINWTSCDRLHQIVRQSFDAWAENNPALHFVDVTDRCTVERAWVPIDETYCADSPFCADLADQDGAAGPGSTAVDDLNDPLICSSKTCFKCERADILIGAFMQGGRQLADEASRMRVIERQLSDQPPLGANGVPQPGGMLTGATLQALPLPPFPLPLGGASVSLPLTVGAHAPLPPPARDAAGARRRDGLHRSGRRRVQPDAGAHCAPPSAAACAAPPHLPRHPRPPSSTPSPPPSPAPPSPLPPQVAHCWRIDADLCGHYVAWGAARVDTLATSLFGVLFFACLCSCLCGCLLCLQKLVTNLLAGWDLDQDGKVEIHEIM